jgi:CO/xanthine dehydrogenase FAD-binding subunit
LDEAPLLAANPNARALAGGQTLVNVMKADAAPELLVDLNDVPSLRDPRDRRRPELGDGDPRSSSG